MLSLKFISVFGIQHMKELLPLMYFMTGTISDMCNLINLVLTKILKARTFSLG